MGEWTEDPATPSGWRYDQPTEMDAQSRAYREMGPDDIVADEDICHFAVRTHPPLRDMSTLKGPDAYEAEGWDSGREDPRP
jgi:hypothetical protein